MSIDHLSMTDEKSPPAIRVDGLALVPLLALLAAVYVLAGKLGLALAVVNPSATPVWAPTGIAIAANLIFGYRVWPAFLMGAFVANFTTAGTIETSVAIAAGNALEGFAGAWLVNRYAAGRSAPRTPAGVFKFSVLAAGLAPVVSATIGVTSLGVEGFAGWSDYLSVWLTWWLGDATGAMIAAPLLLLWSQDRRFRWTRARFLEAAVAFAALILVSRVVFGGWYPGAGNRPTAFLLWPVLIWPALRFGSATVEQSDGQHIFQVQVFLDDLDPNAVSVELYAEGKNGNAPSRYPMNRGQLLVGSTNAFTYSARIPAARSAADFTPRLVPYHEGASIPLEAPFILWHDSPSWR